MQGRMKKVEYGNSFSITAYNCNGSFNNFYGKSEQNGIPSPANFVAINSVSGNITIKIKQGTAAEVTKTIPLQADFRSIGKNKDCFIKQNGIWYEKHFIEEVIFDGNEDWRYFGDTEDCVYEVDLPLVCIDDITLCTYAIDISNFDDTYNNYWVFCQEGYEDESIHQPSFCRIKFNNNINTISDWKKQVATWKKNNKPIMIQYVLKNPKLIKCTTQQTNILNELYNFIMYNGTNTFTITNTVKPDAEFLYYDTTEADDNVYVLDKYQQLIAVFNKDDEDTAISPQVEDVQNRESILTLSLPLTSEKWKQINNPENLYYTDNKVFSTNFEGSFVSDINENNEDIVSITAYERQKLLERSFVKAWNSETGFANIDTFMCVILSNGDLQLKNNGTIVPTTHLKGTSGYVLDALLYGTGWTTGVCDVEGTFDFETDQVDIYNNILKVQELWGGILVIDSVSKIIHHRDETKYLPYDGFEVRYQKNMQSLEKQYNNKIITELCPLGEGGLNIKDINGGSEWISNYSYTQSKLQGIENNPDITDPVQLKKWGERKLKDLCKPRKELNVKTILLNQLEGFEYETISLNDIVDVLEYKNVPNTLDQLRVIQYIHNLWDNSNAEIVLSDITLDSTDIFKKTVSATNSLNNGTISSDRIVDFFNNGDSIANTLIQVNQKIIDTKTDLQKTDTAITETITQVESQVNTLNGTVASQKTTIEKIEKTIEGLRNTLSTSGGSNWIKNSVGILENDYWEGSIDSYTNTDVQLNNEARNAIRLNNGTIMQEVLNLKNAVYNVSFNYKKLKSGATGSVNINGEKINLTATNWTSIERVLNITNNEFRISFTSDTVQAFLISDLILTIGAEKQVWSQHADETTTDTVQIGKGIKVESSTMNIYTKIDADGNRILNKANNMVVAEFTDKGSSTENLTVNKTAHISGLFIQSVGRQVWINSLL